MNGLSERAAWALSHYGSAAVFFACAVEALLVPIPTPPFVMGAGAFLISQDLSWRQALLPMLLHVAVPGAAGTAVGSLAIYGLCFWGGHRAVDRYGRFFGVGWDGVQRLNKRIEGQLEIAVLVMRAIPMFPISIVSAAAGLLRMNPVSFVFWSFLGAVFRYMMLGFAGFLTRNSYELAQHHVGHWQPWAALAGTAAVLGAAAHLWRRRRKSA